MNKYLLFILMVPFFLACGEDTPETKAQEEMHDKVMFIHDEVMPEISTINRISRSLKKIKKENQPDSSHLAQIELSLKELESADEGMMNWMQEYKKPGKLRDSKTHEEIMAYLKSEEEKITKVKEMMETSIEKGQQLLESLEQ